MFTPKPKIITWAVIGIAVCLTLISKTHLAVSAPVRTIVFISDLHMGLGKNADGEWFETEDFRWPKAFKGFLNHISAIGNEAVDLVIVGDFLELWQPPAHVACKGPNKNYGCNISEISDTARAVIAGHQDELKDLAKFAQTGNNCVHVIPGNHDSALVIDSVWSLLAEALESQSGCVEIAKNGTWSSQDGSVVAEHGHQIGWDRNRYGEWPLITKDIDGIIYLRRPWGENFVQRIFNRVEANDTIIDNLSPLSAGALYRYKGSQAETKVKDIARLILFNLLETSMSQKISLLGEHDEIEEPPKWDVKAARSMGSQLFAGALAPGSAVSNAISDTGTEGADIRAALKALANNQQQMSDNAILSLCDQLAARKSKYKPEERVRMCPTLDPPVLGSLIEQLVSSRKRVVSPYVEELWSKQLNMRTFVYGHTHAFEKKWPVKISSRVCVNVINDGAFQRVINDEKFRGLAESKNITPSQALNDLGPESLPACYTFAKVFKLPSGEIIRELKAWHMKEDGEGRAIDVCDSRCADVGKECN